MMRAFPPLFLIMLGGFFVWFHFATRGPIRCDPSSLVEGQYTREQLLEKCGAPAEINASSYGEQWIYSDGFPMIGRTYLYVRGGRFSSAQWKGRP